MRSSSPMRQRSRSASSPLSAAVSCLTDPRAAGVRSCSGHIPQRRGAGRGAHRALGRDRMRGMRAKRHPKAFSQAICLKARLKVGFLAPLRSSGQMNRAPDAVPARGGRKTSSRGGTRGDLPENAVESRFSDPCEPADQRIEYWDVTACLGREQNVFSRWVQRHFA